MIYSKPVTPRAGATLYAKASRIGFEDSAVLRPGPGTAIGQAEADTRHPVDTPLPLGALRELATLRDLDWESDKSVALYLDKMTAPAPSLRYWAVVLLHQLVDPELRQAAWVDAVAERLADSSGAVRIAAAHALCDWGRPGEALPVLVSELSSDSQSVRLFAVTALKHLGEKARHALPALERAKEDAWENVAKVARSAVSLLSQ